MWDGLSAEAMALIASPWELWGALTGFLCVWLAARGNVLNWPVAIVSTLLYLKVFYDAHLFSDSVLQIIFIFSQIYGWIMWLKNHKKEESGIKKLDKKHFQTITFLLGFLTTIWYIALIQIKPNASMPIFDSITTILSLVAVVLQAKKILQCWWIWIVADVIYVPMYLYKNLYLTAILYILFLFLAAYGLKHWKTRLKLAEKQNG